MLKKMSKKDGESERKLLYDQVLDLKLILIKASTGGRWDRDKYIKIRNLLMSNNKVKNKLPSFVRISVSLDDFWQLIKTDYSTYKARRDFLNKSFKELLNMNDETSRDNINFIEKTFEEIFNYLSESEPKRPVKERSDFQITSLLPEWVTPHIIKGEILKILDVGCGKGRVLNGLIQLYPDKLSLIDYIGIDIEEKYIEEAKVLINQSRFYNVEFYDSSKRSNIYEELKDTFDLVFCVNTLHEIKPKDLPEFLIKMIRCVNKKGRLIIHDMEALLKPEVRYILWKLEDITRVLEKMGYNEQEILTHRYQRQIPMYTISIPYKDLRFEGKKIHVYNDIVEILSSKKDERHKKDNEIENILKKKIGDLMKIHSKEEIFKNAIINEEIIQGFKIHYQQLTELKWYNEFIDDLKDLIARVKSIKELERENLLPIWRSITGYLNYHWDYESIPEEIYNDEKLLNKEIYKFVSFHFSTRVNGKIQLHEELFEGRHVNLTVASKIAIKVEKLCSKTSFNKIKKQIVEDLVLGDYHLGILIGIDMTKNGIFSRRYRRDSTLLDGDRFCDILLIVKPFPYIK